MEITIGADGGKNCHITLTGEMRKNTVAPVPIVYFNSLNGSPGAMRLDGIQFALQEKMGFNLWWILDEPITETGVPKLKLIMPIESRGGFDFERIKPIQSPHNAIGMALTTFRVSEPPMTFMVMLDFTKQ